MGDASGFRFWGPKGVFEGLQGPLLQIDIAAIIMHEGDEPDVVIDFPDAEFLARQYRGDIPRLRLIRPLVQHHATIATIDDGYWQEADRDTFAAIWQCEIAEVPAYTRA